MKQVSIFQHLFIDFYSATPKYLQLANSIMNAITTGKIKKDEILPSINELSFEFEISRDTAEKGYKHLKSLGILGSVPGKGYFVQNAHFEQKFKILLQMSLILVSIIFHHHHRHHHSHSMIIHLRYRSNLILIILCVFRHGVLGCQQCEWVV